MTVSQPSEETINILAQDIQTFEQAHATLTAHPHLSPALQDLYFQDTPQNPSLDHLVKIYLQDVQVITASRNHSSEQSLNALQRMEEVGPHLLLNKLDMAVTGFENAAKNNTARLHLLQNISLLSAGLMLILESIFIFWPIQKAVHRAFTRLETHKERLEKAQREVLLQNAQLAKVKEKIEHDALHDPLTQLANRRYLDLVLKEKIAQLPVRNEAISLMHVDLDRFKQINDTLGHAAGDHILCYVADILREKVESFGFIARVGGDEFVILGDQSLTLKDVKTLAGDIIEALKQPVRYKDNLCYFGASIGVSFSSPELGGQENCPEQLLANADIALYRAKENGRGCYEIFTHHLKKQFAKTKQVSDEILAGISRQEFIPHYQLQYDAITHNIVGAEALARWQHPERGILSPFHFLDAATQLNATKDIDHIILEQSIEDMMHWKKVIGTYLPISVNISAQRLIDQNLVRRLENIQVPAKYITFELTETIYFDGVFEKLIETIEAVKSTGIHIEIDDFGTGHASILSLQRIRPRRLKIARELISPMTQSESQQNLVKTIVDLGRSLDIEIIAEGVETMDQADLLKDMGCHIFQGYAFARPMPRESITKTLLTQNQTLPEEGTPSLGSSVA